MTSHFSRTFTVLAAATTAVAAGVGGVLVAAGQVESGAGFVAGVAIGAALALVAGVALRRHLGSRSGTVLERQLTGQSLPQDRAVVKSALIGAAVVAALLAVAAVVVTAMGAADPKMAFVIPFGIAVTFVAGLVAPRSTASTTSTTEPTA